MKEKNIEVFEDNPVVAVQEGKKRKRRVRDV